MATSTSLQSSWRFSNELTLAICRFAGREASAALRIALGKRPIALVAKHGILYEPFTYWDWHDVAPDEVYTSEKRWRQFQAMVEANPLSRRWVKRIAVAHWMTVEDMNW